LLPHLCGGTLDGEAGKRGRAARSGRAVVRREAGIGAAYGHALGRQPELLGCDLREDGPRTLPDLRRADENDHLPVGLHADDRARDGMGSRCEQADGQATADVRLLRRAPADGVGNLLDVADEIGVERLAAGAQLLPGRAQAYATDVERIEARLSRKLVDLQLA